MNEFLQQVINGLSLGSVYALIALGYTMVYGVLKFINFAHGDVYMLGAYSGFYLGPMLQRAMPNNPVIAFIITLIASMIICAAIGVTVERLAYKPLRNAPRLTVLITAIGVSLLFEYGGQLVFGATPRSFPQIIPSVNVISQPLVISNHQLIILGTAIFLMLLLNFIVLKTKLGTAIRAVSYNVQAASLMGINTNVVISFTFALGSALAAAAGVLFSLNYPSIDPLMGILPGLKAFVAAVLGGIGNIAGALVGSFILGLVETFVVGYLSPTYRDAIAFAILILILLFKPSGILGKREIEKV
ncbi:MAG: branched-chain amino acid ABC transporter permease [Rhizobacter sp.]|nr:branched-chain amino acid ABC transporter permease [Chlorobiales bacterium]